MDISKEHIASIFSGKMSQLRNQHEAEKKETSVDFHRTIRLSYGMEFSPELMALYAGKENASQPPLREPQIQHMIK
jgi:hypothetical protein